MFKKITYRKQQPEQQNTHCWKSVWKWSNTWNTNRANFLWSFIKLLRNIKLRGLVSQSACTIWLRKAVWFPKILRIMWIAFSLFSLAYQENQEVGVHSVDNLRAVITWPDRLGQKEEKVRCCGALQTIVLLLRTAGLCQISTTNVTLIQPNCRWFLAPHCKKRLAELRGLIRLSLWDACILHGDFIRLYSTIFKTLIQVRFTSF